jgi:hypothetical protein
MVAFFLCVVEKESVASLPQIGNKLLASFTAEVCATCLSANLMT